jgi:hypothetical protein
MTYSDSGYYEGEFRRVMRNPTTDAEMPDPDGKRHGVGIRVWTNGSKYVGQWAADMMNGTGTLYTLAGASYIGTLWNGIRHGKGVENFGNNVGLKFKCPMGRCHDGIGFCVYTGNYKVGYFEGQGCFVCVDGRKYEGNWLRGQRHGSGHQWCVSISHIYFLQTRFSILITVVGVLGT